MAHEKKDMSRRTFLKTTATAAILAAAGAGQNVIAQGASTTLRLGGPVFGNPKGPDEWVAALKALGYRAAYCPVDAKAANDVVKAYEEAAKKADIAIAEVGAWGNNPISPDEKTRKESIANCQTQLALAERIGARCCVNVSRLTQSEELGRTASGQSKRRNVRYDCRIGASNYRRCKADANVLYARDRNVVVPDFGGFLSAADKGN